MSTRRTAARGAGLQIESVCCDEIALEKAVVSMFNKHIEPNHSGIPFCGDAPSLCATVPVAVSK